MDTGQCRFEVGSRIFDEHGYDQNAFVTNIDSVTTLYLTIGGSIRDPMSYSTNMSD